MHRSRLTSVVIDCAEADYEKGAAFWSAALGRPVVPRNERSSSLTRSRPRWRDWHSSARA